MASQGNVRVISMILIGISSLLTGCDKDEEVKPEKPKRKVIFELYTSENFGQLDDIITFEARVFGNTMLWDSVLSPMRIMDIPHADNKITFEKFIPETSDELTVGFKYTISDALGEKATGWDHDKWKAEEELKIVQYDFK